MRGKCVLLTGATSGIGRAAAWSLANKGARVVILARSEEKARGVIASIAEGTGNHDLVYILCDLSAMDQVRRAAREFLDGNERLDVLANNAGGINPRRAVTVDGFERTFAVNHLSHFLLTCLLLDRIEECAPSRIVITASDMHRYGTIHFHDLTLENEYRAFKAYEQSKLANVLFGLELARRLQGSGVDVNSFHPGAVRTRLYRGLGVLMRTTSLFFKSPERGARTLAHLASSPELEGATGRYFSRMRETRPSPEALDPERAKRLWRVSLELTAGWLR